MTEPLFLTDPYRKTAPGVVTGVTGEGGIILDASLFYARGGGQPGDSGMLHWEGGRIPIATAVKGEGAKIVLVPAEPTAMPPVGAEVEQQLDWDRRYGHMRVHTALHLLSVVIPLPVTGGAIGAEKGRLDFDMPEAPEDKMVLQGKLNSLIDRDLSVGETWITDGELAANPSLVKTMSVQPPKGAGRVRLVRIGEGESQVDLQPCGGTHVVRTGEIGTVTIGKIENKGRQNRRVTVVLAD
ncbi:alanyl-tRNA editing protein [Roseobacter sp. HKCCD9010]|uniref:alanyl-tRNA editing protein n=1 Tax=unclassified Roseobacter TaxID=196798 RepID=UPI0014927A11|nr:MULTISPECIES: alanyl-tRNA editing protein [unclassified Roseobacter]MBF9050480.1 alanyl-tRNA editing protein [Rhodobacterales bacterium HKCCD4356]NNV12103.1 alanyl-tRNA editing protein [Roseobacter sp. HKCCD7357]NNV17117.1 alanyl-tRNA editing protein [Roseobacter sp. HKCCD8768]NNV26346.1 alanyl-tRNA editing protein [Roseobacter sp. HKCCD8192]NNV30841.1 alanyl-tRNA editing protein [Roseobacter sp. HKCCD9061]